MYIFFWFLSKTFWFGIIKSKKKKKEEKTENIFLIKKIKQKSITNPYKKKKKIKIDKKETIIK
jgi:hypothetical protein